MDEPFNGLNLNPAIQRVRPNIKLLISAKTEMHPAPEKSIRRNCPAGTQYL